MEIDDRYWNSSSLWRNNSAGVFSRSSRNEDDEEDLILAAIQRLPTYDRLRKGLIKGAGGEACEVDIKDIGNQEKKNLIDRLVKVDNEKFLLRLKDRIDRVGIDMPTVEVRFENVTIDAKVYIGSRALPSFINFCADIVEGFLSTLHLVPSRKKNISILKGVSGIIKPCRMTLLLGPPGSGKTTLLLALAGMLDTDLKFSGRISYNGHDMHEFLPQKTAAYISQDDVHAVQMTVRETLAFSARCQGVGLRYEMLEELTRREKAANIKPDPDIDIFMKAVAREGEEESVMVDYVLKILGLEACADTMIGNEMVRGVSGGQKKRVTTGEILVGPANVLLMDSISTGLDSSTTFQIINSLKHYVHTLNGTALISLLQPAPETYDLFDNIILLTEGHIVYQGPREHVLEFFETVGFKCPKRKGVADFLQEVTSRKDQMQYWKNKDEPYSFVTAKEFAEAFRSFYVGKRLDNEIAAPFQRLRNHPAALVTTKYGIGNKELLKACLSRELLLMKRFSIYYIVQTIWIALLAVITMTLFLRTKMHRNSIIGGLLFTSSLFITLSIFLFIGLPELPRIISQLPLFYKHRDLLFYPAWAYALPSWILKLPMVFVEVSVWVLPMYYVIGYDPDVGRLFKQWLLLYLFRMMSAGIFRFAGAVGRNLNVSYTFGSFAVLMLFALGGFVISHDNVKKWWIWGYWASPLMYAQNAIAVNEFLGDSWKHVSSYSTEALGVEVLKSRGFFTEAKWYWIGIAVTIGFMVIFNVLNILALAYLRPYKQYQMVMPEETTDSDRDPRAPDTILLPSQERSPETKKRGMVLPFEKHSITFDEMRYSVDMPQEMRNQEVVEDKLELLKGVSGAFRPGILTALMGVSGAGKTTLMDVLAGRKTSGYISGKITVSGFPKKQDTFARISGYCEQNDIHSPYVTVYESLLFSAWLRLPSEIGSELRTNFIEEVMELVELTPLRNALVGLPGVDGLSTEQRKRLTIAVELVANPSIIFMDEPTTGLDARAAAIVMRTVRNIVDTARTIVCTIHQPSIDIFEAFDELFLLTHGGREIYVGPLGQQSCHLIRYFEGIEGVRKIEDGYNPATWMLEVTSKEQEELLGLDFNDVYQQSELYRRNKAMIKELSTPDPGSKELHFPHRYSLSFLAQCKVCLLKQHWSYWRNTSYTAVRFVFTTFIALMFGSLFWDLGSKRKRLRDLLNAIGSMYTAVLFIGFLNAVSVHPIISTERTVFYRERAAGMYSALPYAIAQVIIELPYIFSQTLVYGAIVYAMIGFEWTAVKFFLYILFMFLTLLYFTYFGMMSVGLTPIPLLASIITCATAGLWNIFSGYLIPRPLAPVWWRWFFRVCPFAWTLYGLVASQFGDVKDELEFGVTVEDFLESYFGFRHDFVGEVAAIMCAFVLLFASLFAFSVKVFNFQTR